jgi:RNA polymerase sigma-70 factor (ECF subfamily)
MSDINWAELIQKAAKSDERSQSELISLTEKKVFKFCLLLSGRREIAEDLCQDVYLKALTHLHQLKKPEAFQGWLYQIARNLFLDFKRHSTQKEIPQEEPLAGQSELPSTDLSLEVQKALSHFETDDRILLLLIDLEEYSYAEAAQVLHMTEDAVRSKLHRIRQDFLKIIKKSETNR